MSDEEKKPAPALPYDVPGWTKKLGGDVDAAKRREKHRLIYEGLVNIMGPRYVSDDPSVLEAYGRERQTPVIASKGRAEFVVLPGSTEDVRQILKLANRLKFPWSVMSVGMIGVCFAAEGIPFWCQIDLKRMTGLEIDQKNMYAVVQSYVTNVQLQAEAMQRGLYCGIPSAGGSSSVLGNHIFMGLQSTAYRTGYTSKNILGVEWVLGNGDIVRTGSLAGPGSDYFWGEGPGPDARAVLRGMMGNLGSLGIVTRIAVKLFPWPGPAVWPVEGTPPDEKVTLPQDTFRWFCFTHPDLDNSLKCMREIARCEIGAVLHRNAVWQLRNFRNRSREDFWKRYLEGYWEKELGQGVNNHTMVGVWGWASPKQVEYESALVEEIVKETGGTWVTGPVLDELIESVAVDSIRTQACTVTNRLGYGPGISGAGFDGLRDARRGFAFLKDAIARYSPPLLNMGPADWIAPIDFGHYAAVEIYGPGPTKTEEAEVKILEPMFEMVGRTFQEKTVSLVTAMLPENLTGPNFYNFHAITARIKKALDPNSLANPTRFIDMVEMEKLDGKSAPAA